MSTFKTVSYVYFTTRKFSADSDSFYATCLSLWSTCRERERSSIIILRSSLLLTTLLLLQHVGRQTFSLWRLIEPNHCNNEKNDTISSSKYPRWWEQAKGRHTRIPSPSSSSHDHHRHYIIISFQHTIPPPPPLLHNTQILHKLNIHERKITNVFVVQLSVLFIILFSV